LSLKLCEKREGHECDKNGIIDFLNEARLLKVMYVENYMDFNNEERPGKLFNSYIHVDNYQIEK